jgi:hypothetical protein
MPGAHDLFDADLYRRAEAAARGFLEHDWPHYLRRVESVEAHSDNRDGADKSWVHRSRAAWQWHRQNVERA